MSKYVLLIIFTFTTGFLFAQQNNLEIKGTGNNIFLEHTVTPKESFYSIGRTYNVPPKDLASFNHLKLSSGLGIGDILKIPLNKTNFVQSEQAPAGEALVPVYHTVSSGETLYRLGVNYNKVPLASLKKWNHLSSDAVSVGAPMIVGFLKVDEAHSSLAKNTTTTPELTQPQEKPVVETAKDPEPTEKKIPVNTVKTETPPVVVAEKTNPGPSTGAGYFKSLYDQQTAMKAATTKSANAGVFKSTSGWQDAKYYCFYNDATPGTILKVTDNASGKSIYAKVLDAIPDIKQNSGLNVVISNAAAEQLGVGEKFDCSVSFAK